MPTHTVAEIKTKIHDKGCVGTNGFLPDSQRVLLGRHELEDGHMWVLGQNSLVKFCIVCMDNRLWYGHHKHYCCTSL